MGERRPRSARRLDCKSDPCQWPLRSFHFYHPQKKHDHEYQRPRKEVDDKCKQYIDWAQRFDAKSASWYPREDGTRSQLDCLPILTRDYADDMPGHIETMFDECEDSSDILPVLRRASKAEAGWLARFTSCETMSRRSLRRSNRKSSASCR